MACNDRHGLDCKCGERIRLDETMSAIAFGPGKRGGLDLEKVAKFIMGMQDRIDDLEARLSPLEDHKEAADDAAEAATHRPSCKCGLFGHC